MLYLSLLLCLYLRYQLNIREYGHSLYYHTPGNNVQHTQHQRYREDKDYYNINRNILLYKLQYVLYMLRRSKLLLHGFQKACCNDDASLFFYQIRLHCTRREKFKFLSFQYIQKNHIVYLMKHGFLKNKETSLYRFSCGKCKPVFNLETYILIYKNYNVNYIENYGYK